MNIRPTDPQPIEMRPVAALRPHPNNSRVHPPEQVEQVAASIRRFGFTIPVLVNEADVIIAGHCRVQAAEKLGITEVPCIVARGWSEQDQRAYIIADNKLTENGQWDEVVLRREFAFLRESEDFDLKVTGFGDDEIAALLRDEGYTPVLNPETDYTQVTPEDVARAEAQQERAMESRFGQVLVPLTCPHCGEDFKVDATQIKTGSKAQ